MPVATHLVVDMHLTAVTRAVGGFRSRRPKPSEKLSGDEVQVPFTFEKRIGTMVFVESWWYQPPATQLSMSLHDSVVNWMPKAP